jgi:exodeoxyribonuclease-5
MSDFELTKQQQEAFDLFLSWFLDSEDNKYFTLVGNAGTGKSTLISYIFNELQSSRDDQIKLIAKCVDKSEAKESLKNLRRRPAIISFTNKAVKILKSKGLGESKTIHKLLYSYEYDESQKIWVFERRDKSDILRDHDLLIIDEASMITPTIHKDLLSLDIPMIYVGDNFQLPPILSTAEEGKYGKGFSVLTKPDYLLTDIQRQALNNPILHAASKIRNGGQLNHFNSNELPNYKYFKSISNASHREHLIVNSDIILCGTNNSVKRANDYYRELCGYDTSKYPYKNEKLVIWRNNYELDLHNADTIICADDYSELKLNSNIDWGNIPEIQVYTNDNLDKSIKVRPIFKHYLSYEDNENYMMWLTCYNTIKRYLSQHKSPKLSPMQREFTTKFKIDWYEYKWYEVIEVSFGYAVTTHKSQGSEYENVVVINESKIFKEFSDRWLYTAVTRSKEKLTILDYLFPYNYNK